MANQLRGKRVTIEPHLYEPGDFGKWEGIWHGRSPDGRLCNLGGHEVEDHADGSITVKPSILVKGGGNDGEWHGYLTVGIWTEC